MPSPHAYRLAFVTAVLVAWALQLSFQGTGALSGHGGERAYGLPVTPGIWGELGQDIWEWLTLSAATEVPSSGQPPGVTRYLLFSKTAGT